LGKGGTATLSVNGRNVAEGRVANTVHEQTERVDPFGGQA
jgi:hypothetical protein